jgi:ankyrin repeat protein
MNAATSFASAAAFSRRSLTRSVFCLSLAASLPLAAQIQLPPALNRTVDYMHDVKPLLSKYCYECHGAEKQQSGLRLDLRQNALRGGDYGPVIVPGKSVESRLIKKLVDGDGGDQMPPDIELSREEIGLLRAWIDQGADFRNEVVAEAAPKPVDPKLAALIAAVRSEPRSTVEKRLAENPELLKAADPAKSTLLHHAAAFGSLETMKLLLDSGAAVNAVNRRESTPLHWAIHDEAKIRLLLARGAKVNVKQAEGRTPLYLAAMLGNGHSTIRLLLEHGADPNIKMANGRTPLMAASARGDAEAMKLLIAAKALVNAKDTAGETPLMIAASRGTPAAVELLLQHGADSKAETKRGETALGNAGTAGNEAVVRMLIDHGADVNTRNIRGYSPLMLAAGSDAIPTGAVKLLLAKGADASCKGDYDETARDLAAKRGATDVARALGHAPQAKVAAAKLTNAAAAGISIPDSIERALAMTEKQSFNFIRIGGCNSCHSQDLPSAAAAFARSRGFNAPREIPQLPASQMPSAERVMDFDIVNVTSKGWEMFDYGLNKVPRSSYTDAVVRVIKAMQCADGHWVTTESRRPPMGVGDYQAAALSIFTLRNYAPAGDEQGCEQSIARAVAWLKQSKPTTTQDRAFHLLGLAWGGATPEARAVRALAAMQRPDGGWSQLANTESDAYATGMVLYALHTGGRMATLDPVYRQGVSFLLRTQAADGTWHVKTRAIWLQPYFESGFPYGQDQFISTAGTAWASMALAATQASTLAQNATTKPGAE